MTEVYPGCDNGDIPRDERRGIPRGEREVYPGCVTGRVYPGCVTGEVYQEVYSRRNIPGGVQ